MGGGLMQLVAYGAQDAFLTGNPEITFFKVVYRRHTNFAMEAIEQTFNGGGSARQTVTISRNGDLVTNIWLEGVNGTVLTSNPSDTSYTQVTSETDMTPGSGSFWARLGSKNIDHIDLEIGGQRIDQHYGEWMDIWNDLTVGIDKRTNGLDKLNDAGVVPLQFFFCRNPGLALPLIALQYHEVKLTVNLKDKSASTLKMFVDYIYLDTDERRRFAQVQHNMLIDQVQRQEGGDAPSVRLNFNHPCKELVWKGDIAGDGATLKLNGHERFSRREGRYFNAVQPYQHHSVVPLSSKKINVYSFALKPEEHQPSGTCNFSRIDNAQLDCGSGGAAGNIYAVNYNVLRIMSGMGGLAFSN